MGFAGLIWIKSGCRVVKYAKEERKKLKEEEDEQGMERIR